MDYKCFFCNYETKQLCHFKNHLLKKNKCSCILNNINNYKDYQELITNTCEFCNKIFKRKDNLVRHYIKCKKKKIFSNEIDDLKYKIKVLEQHKFNKSNNMKATNNNLIINNNNYTINNILICNYGSEDRSILTKEFMLQLLKGPYSAPIKMIEQLHFNKNYPENMNIRLSNKSNDKSQLIENGKWITYQKELLINRMVDDNLYYLDIFYEEEIEKGSIERIPHYEEFSKLYHEVMDKDLTSELVNNMNIRLNELMEEHLMYYNS